MKIKFNNVNIEYQVYFKYIRAEQTCPDHISAHYKSEFTECHIESLLNGVSIIATARKAPRDSFNKEIGRKLSFGRALKVLFPTDKFSRIVFWQAYFESTNQHSKIMDLTFLERNHIEVK